MVGISICVLGVETISIAVLVSCSRGEWNRRTLAMVWWGIICCIGKMTLVQTARARLFNMVVQS